jgi:uncharacterized protein (UPF0332 family)
MDEIDAYINYRLLRSKETYSDSLILAQNKSWNSCINRLYYACFYAVNALLIKHGIEAKTHNGVKTLFLKEFVLTNKINKELGKLYADLFDWRQAGDYTDFIIFKEDIVLPALEKTNELIIEIEKLCRQA